MIWAECRHSFPDSLQSRTWKIGQFLQRSLNPKQINGTNPSHKRRSLYVVDMQSVEVEGKVSGIDFKFIYPVYCVSIHLFVLTNSRIWYTLSIAKDYSHCSAEEYKLATRHASFRSCRFHEFFDTDVTAPDKTCQDSFMFCSWWSTNSANSLLSHNFSVLSATRNLSLLMQRLKRIINASKTGCRELGSTDVMVFSNSSSITISHCVLYFGQ